MTEPTIIFEDNDVLVIDKPSGLAVHGESDDATGTVVGWFLEHAPSASGVGEPRIGKDGKAVERSGVVHRLDRDTSGIMILAKTQSAFDHLKAQFKERQAKKEYQALVYGEMKERWGTISRKIGRSARDFRLRSAERGARGTLREAVTNWECLKSGRYQDESFSLVKLTPLTGRTHQLRVHLKSISRPIVGDNLYAETILPKSNNLGLNRLALHAVNLTLTLPNAEKGSWTASWPLDLEAATSLIA